MYKRNVSQDFAEVYIQAKSSTFHVYKFAKTTNVKIWLTTSILDISYIKREHI